MDVTDNKLVEKLETNNNGVLGGRNKSHQIQFYPELLSLSLAWITTKSAPKELASYK